MKANETHYFSNLFDKVLYMFRTCPLSIIRSISTLYTRNRYLSFQFCWLSTSVVILTTLVESQQNQNDKYLSRIYSVEILLIMDSGHVRNMQSTLSNKFEKQCISLAFIIRKRKLFNVIVHEVSLLSVSLHCKVVPVQSNGKILEKRRHKPYKSCTFLYCKSLNRIVKLPAIST